MTRLSRAASMISTEIILVSLTPRTGSTCVSSRVRSRKLPPVILTRRATTSGVKPLSGKVTPGGAYFGARRRMRRQFSNRSNLVWGRMFFAFLGTPLVFIFSLICGIHGLAVLFLIGGWFYLLYPKTSRTKKGAYEEGRRLLLERSVGRRRRLRAAHRNANFACDQDGSDDAVARHLNPAVEMFRSL
jgi:hypothetical protein